MTFTWRNVLDLAKHLATVETVEMQADEEAYYRASVGRAYYACHTSVRHWLENNTQYTGTSANESIHKDVINKINIFISSSTAAKISRRLDSLRLERVKADYVLSSGSWDKQRAISALEDAEDILENLDKSTPKI
jgi:hypothetical protein